MKTHPVADVLALVEIPGGQTRRPQASPQVAYTKSRQFNERISGDSFFIWDGEGVKYSVTHFIDGLTDYHVGDLTDRPDSAFSREILQDLWLGPFGPPDLLITDGGPEFAGQIQILTDLFGMVHEIVPEGAKWRMGQAERHGAIVKLMMMRNVKAFGLAGLKQMRLGALCAFSAKNRPHLAQRGSNLPHRCHHLRSRQRPHLATHARKTPVANEQPTLTVAPTLHPRGRSLAPTDARRACGHTTSP